ncbi:MAG: hypothetical protein L0Y71_01510 [Gemmataceae bacterium]|nr:hypothetical protein [Gemmataceae bacterium]
MPRRFLAFVAQAAVLLLLARLPAATAGNPKPMTFEELKVAFPKVTANTTGNFDTLQKWWQENGGRVTLHDPWLAFLAKQKID